MDTDAIRRTCKRTISDMQRRKISTTTSWFMRGFLSARNTGGLSQYIRYIRYEAGLNSNHGDSELNPGEKGSGLKQRCDCQWLTIPGIQTWRWTYSRHGDNELNPREEVGLTLLRVVLPIPGEEMVLACRSRLIRSANNVTCAYERRHVSLTTRMGRMNRMNRP